MSKKYTYRVRPGRRFGAYFEHGPGSTIELTVEEAEGFPDILELVRNPSPAGTVTTPLPVEEKVMASSEDVLPPEDDKPDDEAYLLTLTVAQLRHQPEWAEVEPPRPTTKAEIVQAILDIRARAKA